MSYLLDALRKSDEERKKNQAKQTSSNFSFTGNRPPTGKRKNTAALILTSFMLVAALILGAGWWWSENDQTQTQDIAGPAQIKTIPPPVDEKSSPQAQETGQSTEETIALDRQTAQSSGKPPIFQK